MSFSLEASSHIADIFAIPFWIILILFLISVEIDRESILCRAGKILSLLFAICGLALDLAFSIDFVKIGSFTPY
jgi:hypothetical protein